MLCVDLDVERLTVASSEVLHRYSSSTSSCLASTSIVRDITGCASEAAAPKGKKPARLQPVRKKCSCQLRGRAALRKKLRNPNVRPDAERPVKLTDHTVRNRSSNRLTPAESVYSRPEVSSSKTMLDSAGLSGLEQRSSQDYRSDGEIDHQSRDVDQGCDKRRRGAGRVEPNPLQNERKHGSGQRAE
jgi:hypothetical protein